MFKVVYDPETLAAVNAAFDLATSRLTRSEELLQATRAQLAALVLQRAAVGERDVERLALWALERLKESA